jgi:diaminopimelate decarboxylase
MERVRVSSTWSSLIPIPSCTISTFTVSHGSCEILQLIAKLAPESCFVVHKQRLLHNLKIIGRVQEETGAKILLALKGFACHATFDIIRPYVAGSQRPRPMRRSWGMQKMGGELHAYAPAYSPATSKRCSQWIDHIVFNSRDQLLRFGPMIRASSSVADRHGGAAQPRTLRSHHRALRSQLAPPRASA